MIYSDHKLLKHLLSASRTVLAMASVSAVVDTEHLQLQTLVQTERSTQCRSIRQVAAA